MLEVRSLAVAYGPVAAVKEIDFDIDGDETCALLGANGAGKTSTLRALSQLVRYSGTIRFDGTDLRGRRPDDVARAGLIHVPEGRHVFPTLTVTENLILGGQARSGRASTFSLSDVYDLFAPLVALQGRMGFTLSGGEQQMVAIGRALMAAPRLLLLDEPSLGLSPIATKVVFDVLRQVGERTPMVIVEQNTTMALAMCSRAVVLREGGIALSGSSADLSDRSELLASFLGQRDALMHS
jgi:branched-chain amino acid transport system ATP-binding protein